MQNSKLTNESTGDNVQIIAWIVLLFVLTFICVLPFLIAGVNLHNFSPASRLFILCITGMTLVGFTPFVSAFVITALFSGADEVRKLRRQIRTWHVDLRWYAIALIGPIVLFLLADMINILLGGASPKPWFRFPPPSDFGPDGLLWLMIRLLLGSLGEEIGWRGFAQLRLQRRYGALTASILVGLIWSTWHSWPAITPGAPLNLTDIVVITYLRLIATAVIYAWMYNSTKGSLFLVMMAHAGHNIAVAIVPTAPDGAVITSLIYVVIAIVIALLTNPQTLTRSKKTGTVFVTHIPAC